MDKSKKPSHSNINWSYIRSGAAAGFVSTLMFTIVHHIFIANIWFSFPVMAAAGLISGISIAWSYGLLFGNFSLSGWLKYNFIYLLMMLLLALCSILYFDPVTTAAEVMNENIRPDDLIIMAIPMSFIFTVIFSIGISLLYGKRIIQYVSILITCSILMLVLGLNVSIIGLVDIPTDSVYLVLELFGLIFTILAVYGLTFLLLEMIVFPDKIEKPD